MVSWEEHQNTLEILILEISKVNEELSSLKEKMINSQKEIEVEEKNAITKAIMEGYSVYSSWSKETQTEIGEGVSEYIEKYPEVSEKFEKQKSEFEKYKEYFWPLLTPAQQNEINKFAGERLELVV